MSHYKRYPAYKDSGVEWLGAIPVDWAVVPLKFLAVIKNGKDHKEVETADGEFPVIGSGGEFARASQFMFNGESVLLGRKGTIDKPLYVNGPFWSVDTMFYTEIGPKTSAKYFFYCTLTIQFNRYSTNTALPSMTQEVLGRILFAIPSHATQCAIADHLDRETVRIDGLITKKTRFIELLREKRQALITRAVTKGLDPKAPMKDSGVAWLGEVPAHWRVLPLKWELLFLTSGSRGWADYYADDGALFIRIGNLTRDSIRLDLSDIQRVLVPRGAEGERTIVFPGDLLFSITAFLGSVAVVPSQMETAYVSQHVALARLLKRVLNPEWVGYVALSWVGKTHLESQGYGGTKIQLSLDDIANLIMLAPPMDEQLRIVDVLAQEMERIDTLIGTSERSIELLKERRSALITAAVTGQIDLRETV